MSGNTAASFISGVFDGAAIQPGIFFALLAMMAGFLALTSGVLIQLRSKRYEATVDEIRKASVTNTELSGDLDDDPIHLQRAEDLALLREYHARSLTQSQLSFRFALGAAVFGFAFIMFSVATVAVGGFDKAGVAGLQLGAGVVVESVAGLFFVLSNQSRTMLGAFFDKLREDRKLDESLRLARELPEASLVRDRLHAALAIQLAGANEAVLSAVLHVTEGAQEPGRAVRVINEGAS